MFRKALALLTWGLVVNGPVIAQSPTVPPGEILGTWVWDVQGRNLAVLKLENGSQGLPAHCNAPARSAWARQAGGFGQRGQAASPDQRRASDP